MNVKAVTAKGCPFLNKNQFFLIKRAGGGWISGTTGAGMSWSNFSKIVIAVTGLVIDEGG